MTRAAIMQATRDLVVVHPDIADLAAVLGLPRREGGREGRIEG
jgi:hypothetical protein